MKTTQSKCRALEWADASINRIECEARETGTHACSTLSVSWTGQQKDRCVNIEVTYLLRFKVSFISPPKPDAQDFLFCFVFNSLVLPYGERIAFAYVYLIFFSIINFDIPKCMCYAYI